MEFPIARSYAQKKFINHPRHPDNASAYRDRDLDIRQKNSKHRNDKVHSKCN